MSVHVTLKQAKKPTADRPGRMTISKWLDSGSGFHPYLGAVIFQILSTSRFIALWLGSVRH
jgi:hypothetical protein